MPARKKARASSSRTCWAASSAPSRACSAPGRAEPVTSLIYTEEPRESIAAKAEDARLERATVVYGWELASQSWEERIHTLVRWCRAEGHGVLFVDNISRASAVDDEAGTELARRVEPLLDLAKRDGIAVIFDRHQRKSGGKIEDLARGTTALAGAVEVILAMQRTGGWTDRRRDLYARGRIAATRWKRTIELSEDGRTYTEVDAAEAEQDRRELVLRQRDEWMVPEFAKASGYSEDTARRWLRTSPFAEQIDGGGKGSVLKFRVLEAPSLS